MHDIQLKITKKHKKTQKNQQKQIKTHKNCEYCDKGTMHLVRRSIKCFRWVCNTCWRTRKISIARLNAELNIGMTNLHNPVKHPPTKNVGT